MVGEESVEEPDTLVDDEVDFVKVNNEIGEEYELVNWNGDKMCETVKDNERKHEEETPKA